MCIETRISYFGGFWSDKLNGNLLLFFNRKVSLKDSFFLSVHGTLWRSSAFPREFRLRRGNTEKDKDMMIKGRKLEFYLPL